MHARRASRSTRRKQNGRRGGIGRQQFGAMERRTFVGAELADEHAPRPKGEFVVLVFRTDFEKRDGGRVAHPRARGRRQMAGDRLPDALVSLRLAETSAIQKFACPACGGEAIWNPAKQKLVCPFCGTESPAKLTKARARSSSTISSQRCAASATRRAAGRPTSGRSSARAATRSRCSIPRGRRRTASSAARRSSCPTRRPSPPFDPRACCRSWSASRRRATAFGSGTASCGWRPTRSSGARSPTR